MKAFLTVLAPILLISNIYGSDNCKKDHNTADYVKIKSEQLDNQYKSVTQKIETVLKKYRIHENNDIHTLPYKVNLTQGKNFIKLEKHALKVSPFDRSQVISAHNKSLTLHINADKVTRIVVEVYKKDYEARKTTKITLVDDSPTSGSTGNITITQETNGTITLKDKKLKDFNNTIANPLRNQLKRDFLISHIEQFSNYMIYIGERHGIAVKKQEIQVTQLLKNESWY